LVKYLTCLNKPVICHYDEMRKKLGSVFVLWHSWGLTSADADWVAFIQSSKKQWRKQDRIVLKPSRPIRFF